MMMICWVGSVRVSGNFWLKVISMTGMLMELGMWAAW